MPTADVDTGQALRDVIRADLVLAGPCSLHEVRVAARASLATLTALPHLIHVARDPRVLGLARVMIDGPVLTACLVLEVTALGDDVRLERSRAR